MRLIYIVTVFTLLITGCATTWGITEEEREVVTIEDHNLTQDQAYSKTLRWAANTYNSANEVIQLQDESSGTIVVSGAHKITRAGLVSFFLSYNMTIDYNDDQVRFTQVIGNPRDPEIGGVAKSDAQKMYAHFKLLREDLFTYIHTQDDF